MIDQMRSVRPAGGHSREVTEAPRDKKTLEFWLGKATDAYIDDEERKTYVRGFVEKVNDELEGPQISCRLLSHKIQSPNEQESLLALEAIDVCIRNCGPRFHSEIAKFRFLNELIKVLSPKYLGSQTSDKVKQRATELLYCWQSSMRHLPKLKQAYEMLKEQAVIKTDPTYMNEIVKASPLPVPLPRLATFEDEEKSKLLASLLKSKNADDLQAANRLIKSMVKAEDQKVDKMTKRGEDLQSAQNNAKLLNEIIGQFNGHSQVEQDVDLMKELKVALQDLRPTLFRYAGEAAENDERALPEILSVNDDVNKTIELFKSRVEPYLASAKQTKLIEAMDNSVAEDASNVDLLSSVDLNSSQTCAPVRLPSQLIASTSSGVSISSDDVGLIGSSQASTPATGRRVLREDKADLGSGASSNQSPLIIDTFGENLLTTSQKGSRNSPPNSLCLVNTGPVMNQTKFKIESQAKSDNSALCDSPKTVTGLDSLNQLSDVLIRENLPEGTASNTNSQRERAKKMAMRDLVKTPVSMSPLDPYAPSSIMAHSKNCLQQNSNALEKVSPTIDVDSLRIPPSLEDVAVALSDIKPSDRSALLIVDRAGVKVVLHYTANRPRPDVLTTVVSISSTNTQQLTDVSFEVHPLSTDVAISLSPSTDSTLPAYNPIFPQQTITRVLLIATCDQTLTKTAFDYTVGYSAAACERSISGSFEVTLSNS